MNRFMLAATAACMLALAGTPAQADEPRKIAFVDTGNTGRSVTAEALAGGLIQSGHLHIAVISRAVDMDPFDLSPEANAALLLKQHGFDVSAHHAAQLTPNDIKHADLVLTMTERHKAAVLALYPDAKAKVFTIAEYASGQSADVADAYGKPMEVYEQMLKQIEGYLPSVLEKVTK